MNKVTTINLNGRAYQLEEDGFHHLAGYLESARTALDHNPDADEIIADLESAIADKCDRLLGSHKNVITTREVDALIKQMGPVESDNDKDDAKTSDQPHPGDKPGPKPAKHLYALRNGAMLAGVCNGIAAFFGIDVTVVRLITVALTFITHGFALLIYIGLALILPTAKTPEEEAEAKGESFDANRVVNDAKTRYQSFTANPDTREKITNLRSRIGHYAWLGAGFVPVVISWIIIALLCLSLYATLAVTAQTGTLLGYTLDDLSRYTYYLMLVAGFMLLFWPVHEFAQGIRRNVLPNHFDHQGRNRVTQFIGWSIWVLSLALLVGLLVSHNFNFTDTIGGGFIDHLNCSQLPFACR